MAKIMGIKKEELAAYKKRKNASEVIIANFLIDFIKENPRNKNIGNILALLIYGLIIFPKVKGFRPCGRISGGTSGTDHVGQ